MNIQKFQLRKERGSDLEGHSNKFSTPSATPSLLPAVFLIKPSAATSTSASALGAQATANPLRSMSEKKNSNKLMVCQQQQQQQQHKALLPTATIPATTTAVTLPLDHIATTGSPPSPRNSIPLIKPRNISGATLTNTSKPPLNRPSHRKNPTFQTPNQAFQMGMSSQMKVMQSKNSIQQKVSLLPTSSSVSQKLAQSSHSVIVEDLTDSSGSMSSASVVVPQRVFLHAQQNNQSMHMGGMSAASATNTAKTMLVSSSGKGGHTGRIIENGNLVRNSTKRAVVQAGAGSGGVGGVVRRRSSNHQINRLKKVGSSSSHVQESFSVEQSQQLVSVAVAEDNSSESNQFGSRHDSFRISKTQKFFSKEDFTSFVDPQVTIRPKKFLLLNRVPAIHSELTTQNPVNTINHSSKDGQLKGQERRIQQNLTPKSRATISTASTNVTDLMSRQTFRKDKSNKLKQMIVSRPSSILVHSQNKENVSLFEQRKQKQQQQQQHQQNQQQLHQQQQLLAASKADESVNEKGGSGMTQKINSNLDQTIKVNSDLVQFGELRNRISPVIVVQSENSNNNNEQKPEDQDMLVEAKNPEFDQGNGTALDETRQAQQIGLVNSGIVSMSEGFLLGREGSFSLRQIRDLNSTSNPPSEIFFSSSNSIYSDVELRELLGSGAYGKVYKGFMKKTGKFIAVKKLTFCSDSSKRAISSLQQYLKEIIFMKHLDHPNIVRYYDCRNEGDSIFVYMEQMTGGSIYQMLEKYGGFNEELIKKFVKQIIQGLAYLHASSIVHRDIKGANILSDGNGNVKLADFGAARYRDSFCPTTSSDSEFCNSVKGSLYWMSPEALNSEPYGRKSDIWSLGCTMIEMATAKHPWPECKGLSHLVMAVKTKQCPQIPEWLSNDCQDFIRKCCTFNKKERPSAKTLMKHPFLKEDDDENNEALID